jgi:hypothetical protein
MTSYEDGYLESHLMSSYSALESMVSGLSDNKGYSSLLGKGQYKKFRKKMIDLIENEFDDENLINGLSKKLAEFQRRPYFDQLLSVLNDYPIDSSLLWPPETDVNTELHNIIKRRNNLIHKGLVDTGNISRFDLNRIQKMIELLILKLLDCPNEAINKYSLWRDAPITKVIGY